MDIKYGYSPIVEAICEFRFDPNPNWDLTTPGMLFGKIKDRFSIKESKQGLPQKIQIQIGKDILQQIDQPSQLLFYSDDRKNFVKIGLNAISIHCLKPYPKWDVFKSNIEFSYEAILKVVNDLKLNRVGLRYINQIEITENKLDLEDYFEFRPFLGGKLPPEIKSFTVGCETEYPKAGDLCRFQLSTAMSGKDTESSFNLDIDYFNENRQALPEINPKDWLEEAHQNISDIFEGSLTEKIKDTFREKASKK